MDPDLPSADVSPARAWSRAPAVVYGAAAAALTLLVAALLIWRPLTACSGLWLHAAVGRHIWQTGRVPDHTLGLWTASEPYVYHSWLAQLLFYGLVSACNPRHLPYAVFAFTAFLTLLPLAFVVLIWRRSGRLTSWMVFPLVFTLQALHPRIETRPELFTGVLLCALLAFLVAWSGPPAPAAGPAFRRRAVLALAGVPLLLVLWANLHAAVILGVLVLGVTAACDLLQDRFDRRALVLAALTPLALAAVCVNPYGLAYFGTYLRVRSFTFSQIVEWLPVWKAPPVPPEVLVPVAGLVALALVAWALNPGRRWAHLGWLLLLGALFVDARRNVLPFALTGLMVLAANARSLSPEVLWQGLSRFSRQPRAGVPGPPGVLRWGCRAAVLAWLALQTLLLTPPLRPGMHVAPIALGQGAARFLSEHDLGGHVFNDYESAGYLEWCLQDRLPLYIDMLDAYPDEVMRDYQAIVGLTERGRELFREQQIEVVVLTTNRGGAPSLAGLAARLDESPRWVRVYAGKDGVVWLRRTPRYEAIWKPRQAEVSKVAFATLERFGRDEDLLLPASRPEDHGGGRAAVTGK